MWNLKPLNTLSPRETVKSSQNEVDVKMKLK